MKNRIMDYEQVLKILKGIEKNSNRVKQQKPIGKTTYGLPILHYTVGTGKNHIVLSAAQHGCEIITTDFLLNAMQQISCNNNMFKFLDKNEYTLHFLPLLNPEGYLITTSAIRKMIDKEMPEDEAQQIYQDYLKEYKKDNENSSLKLKTKYKNHQRYFGHIDQYTILNKRFSNIKNSLEKIYMNSDIPDGALVTWHSNGNGVDLNQNTPYNYKINAIKENKKVYSLYRYDNIEATKPGPIGCPMQGKEFEYEPENRALLDFLLGLKNNNDINLCAYFNYHSTGGILFYRPYSKFKEVAEPDVMSHLDLESIYNKKIAELYSRKSGYRLVDVESQLTCFNDLLRLQIPGDILIELSKTSGNPLGPYAHEEYDKIIEDNLRALAYTLPKLPEMNRIKQEFIHKREQKKLSQDFEER